jgi:acetyltransferase-like isoleucine patch superfamily enzyme
MSNTILVFTPECVTEDVEPYAIVGGVPARLIENREKISK